MHGLIARWRDMGVRVEVATEKRPMVEADAAILHVDRTSVPASLIELASRYRTVINGKVVDISKRLISRQRVLETDGDDGSPVIVKTDSNYGGFPELRHRLSRTRFRCAAQMLGERRLKALALAIERRRSWARVRLLGDYPIYPSKAAVPHGVWGNPNLIVERFLPERSDGYYVCRHWIFLGDRDVCRVTLSRSATVKARNGEVRPVECGVPDELRDIRKTLGFDYGKFDYAMIDGRPVLYDVNRTPGSSPTQTRSDTVSALAGGVNVFL